MSFCRWIRLSLVILGPGRSRVMPGRMIHPLPTLPRTSRLCAVERGWMSWRTDLLLAISAHRDDRSGGVITPSCCGCLISPTVSSEARITMGKRGQVISCR
ncbi:hypothetical protein J6590_033029 [Homalodisca vitripennis]|nr:hypothetical protein J6590_033029 [Homalodisca vitripennis]